MSAYSFRLKEAFGRLCRPSGSDWTAGCNPKGCVHYFGHRRGVTILAGPLTKRAEGVWVAVDGKQASQGVMIATVHRKPMRAIRSKEPFGYFGAYLPGCLEPEQVKVHAVEMDGTQLGSIEGFHGPVPKCRRAGGSRS